MITVFALFFFQIYITRQYDLDDPFFVLCFIISIASDILQFTSCLILRTFWPTRISCTRFVQGMELGSIGGGGGKTLGLALKGVEVKNRVCGMLEYVAFFPNKIGLCLFDAYCCSSFFGLFRPPCHTLTRQFSLEHVTSFFLVVVPRR